MICAGLDRVGGQHDESGSHWDTFSIYQPSKTRCSAVNKNNNQMVS